MENFSYFFMPSKMMSAIKIAAKIHVTIEMSFAFFPVTLQITYEMIPKAIEVVVDAQMASTTLLQRKLKLGYARAARIIDNLEERGIIGPYEGAKPRKVLISKQQWYEMNALAQGGATHDYSESDTDAVVNDAEE